MNAFKASFGESPDHISIDKAADQIAETLKKLTQNKDKPPLSEKLDFSDNSLGSMPIQFKKFTQHQISIQHLKRQNPIKIRAVPCKKQRAVSEYQLNNNDDSQFIDSMSNRKLTQYCNNNSNNNNNNRKIVYVKSIKQAPINNPNSSNQQDNQQQLEIVNHPVVKALKQKIYKKEKTIQELNAVVEKIREKNQKYIEQFKNNRDNQLQRIIQFISQKYSQKIYMQRLQQIRSKKQQHSCHINKYRLAQVQQKLQQLKNEKNIKKGSKSKLMGEEVQYLEVYGQERQAYLASWKKKLQNQRTLLEKQVAKSSFCDEIEFAQQKYYPLTDLFLDETQNRKIFEKIYLPLYCRSSCQQLNYEIRTLNLSNLSYENLLIVSYPKMMKKQRRMQIKSHIKQVHQKSKHLNDELYNSIFINHTIFTQVQNFTHECFIIGRQVWEQNTVNLKQLINRYEYLPENIGKYIVKNLLRAHERIRRELNHEAIILPQNIIFNQRSQMKIDNWVYNQTIKFQQYSVQELTKQNRYLYFPPEYKIHLFNDGYKNHNIGIWTAGVILFEILFGKKPFQYNHNADHQQFYLMNELQFPPKPQGLESSKEMIKLLLARPQNRINYERALKHPYWQIKK